MGNPFPAFISDAKALLHFVPGQLTEAGHTDVPVTIVERDPTYEKAASVSAQVGPFFSGGLLLAAGWLPAAGWQGLLAAAVHWINSRLLGGCLLVDGCRRVAALLALPAAPAAGCPGLCCFVNAAAARCQPLTPPLAAA